MNYKVSAQSVVAILFVVVACAIIAVTNQVAAEEQAKNTSKMILAHPSDKVGIPIEEQKLEEAENQAETNGNILVGKEKVVTPEKVPEELTIGPTYNEQWPQKRQMQVKK